MKIDSLEFKEWFDSLWCGTTSAGRQVLYANNETLSLVKIHHRGFRNSSGYTEWVVAINGEVDDHYYYPKFKWRKEGRLTKEDKLMIKEKYNLHPVIKMVL